ncbi:Tim44 domain-containing protein [Rhodoferax mekongensis]|uniref:Tim44 domain-containing protein n=1 Tax=Rhodoferax mekongensis TaxID=3068341 RepID=UPI0028BD45E8|nr:TIM44-like domain-containing protein [Rhodoferax sp. TBRC 17199]MDT7514505.1 TIM44-like domain-containing protein [Rhodoferax sp. TBRC 17199]
MKKLLSVLAVVFSLGIASVSMDAEAAKRLGSGKSMGTQRQAVQDKAPSAPTAQNATPAAGAGAGAAAASKPSWMGPVAGLAAGLGIAALASHFGFGDELASMMTMALVAFAVMAIIGFIMRKRAMARQGGMAGAGGMMPAGAAAGAGTGTSNQAFKVANPAPSGLGGSSSGSLIGSGIGAQTTSAAIPADFDRAGFERNAKVNFIRLQAAYDAGNLDDIREFTTPEMFAEIKLDFAEREAATQTSEVVRIDSTVLEVVEEANRYLVSVKFTGFIRFGAGCDDEPFDEVWHLTKARQGNGGWVLAGIQQVE